MKDQIKMIKDAQAQDIPTFTLKANDVHATDALLAYQKQINSDPQVSQGFKNEIKEIIFDFIGYALMKPLKTPD